MRPPVRYALLCALASAGCGGVLAKTRAENARLDGTVAELRAEVRRDKRHIRELENQLVLIRDRLETAQVEAIRVGDVPPLPVEVVAPVDAAPAADVDPSLAELGADARIVSVGDDGTEIVYVGDAAAGKSGTLSGDDLEPDRIDRIDQVASHARPPDRGEPRRTRRAAPAPRATSPAMPVATERYQQALAQLRAGDHAAAIAGFRELLARFPDHALADNAQYWLGEAYYDQKDYARAAAEFRQTVTRYPRGNKAPDALLKLGFSYLATGQAAEGRQVLQHVVEVYPRSEPATLAIQRLGSLDPLDQGGSP